MTSFFISLCLMPVQSCSILILLNHFCFLETAAQATACPFSTMARRPIVGGNWKCNPDSFSKLDDLIKIMKLGLRPKVRFKVKSLRYFMTGKINRGLRWRCVAWDGNTFPNQAESGNPSSSIRNECDTSGCDVFVCPSPLHVAYVASKVKDTRDSQPSCGTCCVWHHLLNTCSGEHPCVCPELWLQGLWRFHWRNRRGAIEGAPWSDWMDLRVFILKSTSCEHIAPP